MITFFRLRKMPATLIAEQDRARARDNGEVSIIAENVGCRHHGRAPGSPAGLAGSILPPASACAIRRPVGGATDSRACADGSWDAPCARGQRCRMTRHQQDHRRHFERIDMKSVNSARASLWCSETSAATAALSVSGTRRPFADHRARICTSDDHDATAPADRQVTPKPGAAGKIDVQHHHHEQEQHHHRADIDQTSAMPGTLARQ